MLEALHMLAVDYKTRTGKDPEIILCSIDTSRMLKASLAPDFLDLREPTVYKVMGLAVTPIDDLIPGAIIVCRVEDRLKYRPTITVELPRWERWY